MRTLDAQAAYDLLAEVVAGREDYVYEKVETELNPDGLCVYFHPATEKPSCLVGHAFARCGVTLHDLEFSNMDGVDQLPEQFDGIELTYEATAVFKAAQSAQDSGQSWGEALRLAREVLSGQVEYTEYI